MCVFLGFSVASAGADGAWIQYIPLIWRDTGRPLKFGMYFGARRPSEVFETALLRSPLITVAWPLIGEFDQMSIEIRLGRLDWHAGRGVVAVD